MPDIPKATHGSPDAPLRIGEIEIPCYVLEDRRRVITQTGMLHALDMGRGGPSGPVKTKGDAYRLGHFVGGKRLSPFIGAELLDAINAPVHFHLPTGQRAYGYEATVLADMCDAVLEARKRGVLTKQQLHIAEQAEILVRAFARVGIIALVDEATGYQADRDRRELHRILEAYIQPEFLPWTKRFPDVFYTEMFRLRGWGFDIHKGPRKVGELTAQVVYEKLPHGVLDELRRQNPVVRDRRRRHKHHQYLSEQIGNQHLHDHVQICTALMRASTTWDEFVRLLHKAVPSPEPLALPPGREC
jgi:P63C domain-containing protein